MYDIIIIGAGPAGMTAAIYGRRANKKVLVLEALVPGGQIINTKRIVNYPGFSEISGVDFANNLFEQASNLGAEFVFDKVISIDTKELTVTTNNDTYKTRAIILAMGVANKKTGLENEDKFLGRGVSYCATCDGNFYKGKDVAIIGGANTAVTNALYMSNLCEKVYLIYHGSKLKCEKALLDGLKEKDNIEVLYNSNVIRYIGEDELEGVVVQQGEEEKEVKVQGMFISIGLDAQTSVVENLLPLSEQKYILSEDCNTLESGIFVAGDCRTKAIRQLTTAVSDGAIAASNAIKYVENESTLATA